MLWYIYCISHLYYGEPNTIRKALHEIATILTRDETTILPSIQTIANSNPLSSEVVASSEGSSSETSYVKTIPSTPTSKSVDEDNSIK